MEVKSSTQLIAGHVLFTNSNTNNGSCVLFQSIVEKVKSSTQLIVGHVLCPDSGSCFISEYCRGSVVLDTTDYGSCFVYQQWVMFCFRVL